MNCGNFRGAVSTPSRHQICSISPAGLLGVFLGLACVTLGIGAGFAALGAWPVLPFAGLEVLVLGAAFVLHARHVAGRLDKNEI